MNNDPTQVIQVINYLGTYYLPYNNYHVVTYGPGDVGPKR